MTSTHSETLAEAAEILEECDILIQSAKNDDDIDVIITVDDENFDNDVEAVTSMILMIGTLIGSMEEMTVFSSEQLAVMAIENYEASQQD